MVFPETDRSANQPLDQPLDHPMDVPPVYELPRDSQAGRIATKAVEIFTQTTHRELAGRQVPYADRDAVNDALDEYLEHDDRPEAVQELFGTLLREVEGTVITPRSLPESISTYSALSFEGYERMMSVQIILATLRLHHPEIQDASEQRFRDAYVVDESHRD